MPLDYPAVRSENGVNGGAGRFTNHALERADFEGRTFFLQPVTMAMGQSVIADSVGMVKDAVCASVKRLLLGSGRFLAIKKAFSPRQYCIVCY